VIELSNEIKDMQNEYDELDNVIQEHTNESVWEDKQVHKE